MRGCIPSRRIPNASVDDDLVEGRGQAPVRIAFEQPQIDQLGDVGVDVLVVAPELAGQSTDVQPVVPGNETQKFQPLLGDGREQLAQAAERETRCRRAARAPYPMPESSVSPPAGAPQ